MSKKCANILCISAYACIYIVCTNFKYLLSKVTNAARSIRCLSLFRDLGDFIFNITPFLQLVKNNYYSAANLLIYFPKMNMKIVYFFTKTSTKIHRSIHLKIKHPFSHNY